jgi:pyruvate formate lyase activating enzyme
LDTPGNPDRINDNKESIRELAEVIKGANVKKIELLPYHKMGVEKWKQLGLSYTLKDMKARQAKKSKNYTDI